MPASRLDAGDGCQQAVWTLVIGCQQAIWTLVKNTPEPALQHDQQVHVAAL
jgi:hypothetical protein